MWKSPKGGSKGSLAAQTEVGRDTEKVFEHTALCHLACSSPSPNTGNKQAGSLIFILVSSGSYLMLQDISEM